MGEVTDITRDNGEAVQKSDSSNAKVLRANADALQAQLSKNGISLFGKEKDVPWIEVVNSADKGSMPLRRLARIVPMGVE